MNAAIETPHETDKLSLIREIKKQGVLPEHFIIRHGLSEKEAFEVEATLIDFSRLCQGRNFKLTNLVRGTDSWERGIKTSTDIVQFYDARVITIEEPSLIIRVNKLYYWGMPPEDLYKVTRERWVLHKHRIKNIKFVIAAYFGIVREVYEVEQWYESFDDRTQKVRFGFTGKIAVPEIRDKYLNQSLKNYKSGGNPIQYVNC